MNYKIITDEIALREFIDWLPDLKHNETFYVCLFARNKYVKGLVDIKTNKAQLKRFTSNKSRLFNKIKQLECPVGSYHQKDITIPQEALALYITINPRDFVKATKNGIKRLLDLAMEEYSGYHPHQELMSSIQKSKSDRTEFVTFDFDMEKLLFDEVRTKVSEVINKEAIQWVETRGGYHLTIRTPRMDKQYTKTFHNDIKKILNEYSSDTFNVGDVMLPVPGTIQGGFTPKLLK